MKKIFALILTLSFSMIAIAQTLNVTIGNVTYQFAAAQVGDMTYQNGTTLTIQNKSFALSDITCMKVEDENVEDNNVSVVYSGSTASVFISGNIAQYVTPTVSGAHVNIAQSDDLAEEITYTLSGTSGDGEFYMSGSYKATVVLNGLTLTNINPVTSGAAIHIQDGKRIKLKVATGTINTLTDASGGTQKACLYIKGHAEVAQKGVLNIVGNVKHGIKVGEYLSLKNATINVTSAPGDGISCSEYFLMESGTIKVSGVEGDGIQCDIDGETTTGETADHEDEDSGNIYLSGGAIDIVVAAKAAKGIKGEGDIQISDGTIQVKTSGDGEWDSDASEAKASCALTCDGNMTISGGTLTLTSTGSGGKGIKCDGVLTVSGGDVDVTTSGGLYYNNGTTENVNYTGDTDRISNSYYSSPKGIKAGVKTANGSSYTYSGGVNISGGTITVSTSGHNAEGIESKNYLNITGGHLTINAYDDAINSGQDMTISDGYIYAHSTGNDGLDSNGNLYVKGGLVYAIGTTSPELAIDANSEEQKKFYFTGGTLVAIGGVESGSSLSQACYASTSWNKSTWYALYDGSDLALAFKTPTSGGTTLVVSTSGTTTLKSGVTISGGTAYFGGVANVGGTVSGGTTVSLSQYTSSGSGSGGNPGGGGNRPGGGRPGGW